MKVSLLVLLCIVVASVLTIEAVLNNKIRKSMLKSLNKYRSKVAKGKVANKTGKLPKASNMYQLTWSKKLEKKALTTLKTCKANITTGSAFYNQNITLKAGALMKTASKAWYASFQKYGIPSLTFNFNDSFYKNITDYSDYANLLSFQQVIWAKSKEVGCNAIICRNATTQDSTTSVLCLFKAAGLVNGQPIYKKGKKLKCPKKTKKVKKTGLCKVKGKKGKTIHK